MPYINRVCLFLSFIIFVNEGLTQNKSTDTSAFKIIIGESGYKKSKFYQWLWGRNRRTEWATPIHIPVLWLDSANGGLIPYKTGGGNETKSLRLKTKDGKEYSLRSVNKSRDDVILPVFKHTFIEDIINDGISMSHPYGALGLPVMEKIAGIYHTNPEIVYLPQQTALDTFNKKFGDNLYLFEQRLDGNWSDADNLGNFKNFSSTDEVIDKLKDDNENKADQYAFVKARLFDMLIADWDRHEDNWQWGLTDTSGKLLYEPVPRDRDQAFFTHNGALIDGVLPAAGLGFMQNFDYNIPSVKTLNFEERNIDRFFTNEMTLDNWVNAAKSLQKSLSDSVIELSIQQLPPEIFSVSGNEIIAKLKSRRNHLVDYAIEYYQFIANEVEVIGSKKKEYFDVKLMGTGETSLNVYRINKEGKKSDTALYSRIFRPAETKKIRLYGLEGEDIYVVEGNSNSIKVSIIGGIDKDSVIQHSGNKIHIYDDYDNVFKTTNAKLHLSSDSAIHVFNYTGYNYNSKGIKPSVFYNNDDRLYVGWDYAFKKYKWRRNPFATKQLFDLHYSISQKAISTKYTALFPNLINKWNLSLSAGYDAVKWTNFFGLGNKSVLTTTDKNYFRMRAREWWASGGLEKTFGKSNVSMSAFFQSIKIISDTERYVAKIFLPINMDAFETNNYAGAKFTYTFVSFNDSIIPTRGITFSGNASYFINTTRNEFFQKYFGKLQAYIPLGNKFSLAIKAGGATIFCKPDILNSAEFYEHAVIGGPETLRGFKRERLWGKTSFYNNNELRFISNVRTHVVNAKAGLLIFFDDGKVWMPHENSGILHTGYGAGVLLAPFNKIAGTVTYGISKESRLFQVCVNKLF